MGGWSTHVTYGVFVVAIPLQHAQASHGSCSPLIEHVALVEETKNLASCVLTLCLIVVQDTVRCGKDDLSEKTGRQQIHNPLLNAFDGDIVTRGDASALVDTADELDDNFSRSVIVHDFKLAQVSVLLHELQELDHDLGGWTDQNLALASLLSI